MGTGKFVADTSGMRSVASAMEKNTQEYDACVINLYRIVNEISASWIGQDSNAYVANINEQRPLLDNLAVSIRALEQSINTSASGVDDMVNGIMNRFK